MAPAETRDLELELYSKKEARIKMGEPPRTRGDFLSLLEKEEEFRFSTVPPLFTFLALSKVGSENRNFWREQRIMKKLVESRD